MKKYLILLTILLSPLLVTGGEKLSEDYLISYGDPNAKTKLIQYFSFTCPHCVALFRNEFQEVKTKYIDTNQIFWVFHPVPVDTLTIQGMHCLEKLSDREKKIFLEAILEELLIEDFQLSSALMQKAMEILERPIPDLQNKNYLIQTQTFEDAFQFIKDQNAIEAVPSVEINGTFLSGAVPDISFLKKKLSKFINQEVMK